ncbi:hypothetical protein BJY21_003285 [Kineosphaera limosa]|uniref:Uncharacterized protein n=1 Tax=Kineosphaera limosa NBRC 100340 TaxID=1184609 RepID=K6WTA6_9MICO|nr:hypothetical protein [Kineosphaera limosa]NYE02101.1 hypothetical protein [Kineosphaera limosa]GAB95297.1 hypothetical protein KILIM_018_00440 [Kineosphaera limosa NBRC 100340]
MADQEQPPLGGDSSTVLLTVDFEVGSKGAFALYVDDVATCTLVRFPRTLTVPVPAGPRRLQVRSRRGSTRSNTLDIDVCEGESLSLTVREGQNAGVLLQLLGAVGGFVAMLVGMHRIDMLILEETDAPLKRR